MIILIHKILNSIRNFIKIYLPLPKYRRQSKLVKDCKRKRKEWSLHLTHVFIRRLSTLHTSLFEDYAPHTHIYSKILHITHIFIRRLCTSNTSVCEDYAPCTNLFLKIMHTTHIFIQKLLKLNQAINGIIKKTEAFARELRNDNKLINNLYTLVNILNNLNEFSMIFINHQFGIKQNS